MTHYRIRNWDKHFENNRTRELKKMDWVPVPNKHDGEGFLTIMEQKDGLKIYACWHLLLQVASKCGVRGTLLRDDGTPHTAESIARKCSCRDVEAMKRAIDFCSSSQVSWLEVVTDGVSEIPHRDAEIPQETARKGREGNEGNEGNVGESEEVKTRWNNLATTAGLPLVHAITPERLKKYRLRLVSFPDFWDTLKKEIPNLSMFARGKQEGSSWRVSFDFCIESDGNFLKLKEGKYARPQPPVMPI